MATRISQSQLNKFISPEAAMAPYERAQQDKTQRNAQDAALAQLIKGKELDQTGKQEMLTRQIGEAERLRGQYGPEASVNVEGVSVGARDPLQSLLRQRELQKPSLTPGQEAADKAFGKEYSDFIAGGGSEAAQKNLRGMEDVQDKLRTAKEPNLIERAAGYLPDSFRAAITPEAKAREDEVKGAIQNTLRQTLGSQFTEKEGTAILNRAYDPRLSNAENLKRVQKEAQALKSALEQKMQSARQFEGTGSLVGLGAATGRPGPTMQQQLQQQAPAPQGGSVSEMSDEQLKQLYQQLKGGR